MTNLIDDFYEMLSRVADNYKDDACIGIPLNAFIIIIVFITTPIYVPLRMIQEARAMSQERKAGRSD